MQLDRALIVVLVAGLLHGDPIALYASDLFTICHRNDTQLSECLKRSLDGLRPTLRSGIPQLKIPPMDPLLIPELSMDHASGPVTIDSTFRNLHIQGITNFRVRKVTTDLENYRLQLDVAFPYVQSHGDYKINGKILVLPISGSGDCWNNYTGIAAIGSLIGHKESRNGQDYMKVDEFKFSIGVNHADIHFNNLFNGNKELGESMNELFSQNWEAVFQELKPLVDEIVSAIFTDVARKVFERFPFAELFPVS